MAQPLIDPDQLNLNPATTGVGVFMPTGGIIPFAGSLAPGGYLLCDGEEYNPAEEQYAPLFAVIGTTYNTGGETPGWFRVPDLRGRVVLAMDNMGGSSAGRVTDPNADVLGGDLGDEDSVVVSHNHPGSTGSGSAGNGSANVTIDGSTGSHSHSVSGGSHSHSVSVSGGSHGHGSAASTSHTHSYSGTTSPPDSQDTEGADPPLPGPADQHRHTYSGGTSGPTGTKTISGGSHTHSGTASSSGSDHSHSTSGGNHTHVINQNPHTHSVSVGVSVASDGISGNRRNVQPSFALNYIISLGL